MPKGVREEVPEELVSFTRADQVELSETFRRQTTLLVLNLAWKPSKRPVKSVKEEA